MVKFYRGLYSNYNYDKTTKTGKHADCVYFATDVGRILMNGIEFGSSIDTSLLNSVIKDVSITNNVLTFTLGDDSTFDITIPTATLTTNGVMSSSDKKKLDRIQEGANNYTHPSYTASTGVPTSNLTPSFGGTFLVSLPISDSSGHITSINTKTVTIPSNTATTSANGLMSSTDKSKLDGISAGAQVNQNAFSNIKVGTSTISADSATDTLTLAAGSNITIATDTSSDTITISSKNTTYGAATTSSNGLMSSSDKSKLDGIAANANNYSLPTASSTTLGGVKTGTNITNSSGTISITKDNVTNALGYTPPTKDTTYSVMTGATSSEAGAKGLVPAPAAGKQTSFLRGDGTWVVPTNTTYSAGAGISLSGTTFSNSGVRSVAAGSNANQLSVNTNGTTSTITINNVANATAADKLKTGRTIALSGAVTGSVTFDGSANKTISTTLSNFDASKITTGTIDLARIPKAAIPELKIVADDTARFALTTSDIQNGDTVQVTSTGKMYFVKDQTKLSSEDGYIVYTAGAASSVPWSGVTGKPSSYTPSAHTQAASTITGLATVATSGSYADLSNKPTIPSKVSQLTNDSGYITGVSWNNVSSKPTSFTPSSHNQASNTITALTGYSKPSATSAIGTSDSLNSALGKLEKGLDGKLSTSGTAAKATAANKVIAGERHAETASGTTGNAPTTGMLYSSGMYMTLTYHDSATPISFGNIINLAGTGTGLLLCEWSGEDNTLGHLYYRSHRDTSTGGWSNWGKVAFTTDTVAAATNDSAGLLINTTYIKGLSVSGKTITYTKGDGTTGTITTQDTNTTYSAFKGATSSAAGGAGLVPAPAAGAQTKYLRADGTWQTPPDTNTTYSVMKGATADAAGAKGLVPAPAAGKQTSFLRGDGTWVVPTNTTYSAATSSNLGLVKIGSNITVSSGTISLTKANVTNALGYTPPTKDTNTHYTTHAKVGASATATANAAASNGSVYLNILDDSTVRDSHLIKGAGATTVTSDANGVITISSTDTNTNTTYSAGTGISLSGTTFSNAGVRSIATGSSNGTISVNTNGTTANVAVKGLGSAAYTNSSTYAKASHTHTGAQVTMSGYSTLSGGYVTTSDTVNSAVHKIEDLLLWYELN